MAPLPSVRLAIGEGRIRTYGYLPDGHFPEPDELARIVVLGIDELSAPEDDVLLIAFLTAISTLCRPKECLPREGDMAPLANVHKMVYLDAECGKTGSRELYVPQCAVRIFGFSASWFASRSWADPHPLEVLGLSPLRRRRPRWHPILPTAETDRARETLQEACRRLRVRYEKETGSILPDRLAYVTRKLLAGYLWRLPIDPAYALTDVLGHHDLSGDEPYTAPMASEVLAQNTILIEAARRWGAPRWAGLHTAHRARGGASGAPGRTGRRATGSRGSPRMPGRRSSPAWKKPGWAPSTTSAPGCASS